MMLNIMQGFWLYVVYQILYLGDPMEMVYSSKYSEEEIEKLRDPDSFFKKFFILAVWFNAL